MKYDRILVACILSIGMIFAGCGNNKKDITSYEDQIVQQALAKASSGNNLFKVLSENEQVQELEGGTTNTLRGNSNKVDDIRVLVYTDPETEVQYLIINEVVRNRLGDYVNSNFAVVPRYGVNKTTKEMTLCVD